MSHFAVFAPPLRGHYAPLSALAAELIARGHRVTFVHQEEAGSLVTASGADFAAIGGNEPAVESWTRPMRKIRGLLGLGGVFARMQRFTTLICGEGPTLLRRIGADAVIADQLEPGGALVAEHLRLPWISTATTIPMNREAGVPPPFLPWPYERSDKAHERNRWGWKISDWLMSGVHRNIARNARRLGLPARRTMEDCFSPLLQLSQGIRSLDFPRERLPGHFHHTGPWRQPVREDFEIPASDGRPTAYATLGTLQGSRTRLFRRIAQACAENGVRLILTHGGLAKAGELDGLPGMPLVRDWMPQEAVLRQVDLVICHAGMNSVLDPAAAGVPLIVMPLAFEQPGIAARVAASGAGLMLGRSGQGLEGAIRRVLAEPRFRDRAQELNQEIAQAGGVARAADLIERAIASVALPEDATTARRERGGVRDDSRSESK